ncbi:MAG: hypothetical protein IME96_09375 [Proteobacteria bacterium]|nr:hypothetical protein [Pseudomonadota bacterium]
MSLSGQYRNLLIYSQTTANKEDYYLDSNRLRVEAKGETGHFFSYNVQYDNDVVFGDYLETGEFAAIEANASQTPRRTYWDLDGEISSKDRLRWNHSLHRGYGKIKSGDVDLTIGRQRIAWGRGWFFSPLDIFNPLSPTAIERGERDGVDGVVLELSSGIASKASLVYLPMKNSSDTFAAKVDTLIGSYDIALTAGSHVGVDFIGADFTGYVGDAGFKGELAFSRENHVDNLSWLLSGNYGFDNSLTIMVEYFYNDGGSLHPISYGGENYIGVDVGYDLTPLTRFENLLILNLMDGSRFYSPFLASSLRENMDLTLGIQLFAGDTGNEFGGLENLAYAQFSLFF